MAGPTRLYLPPSSAAPGISPTQHAQWDATDFSGTPFVRVIPSLTKTNTAFADKNVSNASGSTDQDGLIAQFIYPMSAGVPFATTNTIKGRVLAREYGTADNVRSQCIIRVVASNGTTVQATLYGGDLTLLTGNPVSEWYHLNARNIQMPRGTTVACAVNYTTVTGDYLVIEIGARKHATAASTNTIRFGDNNATDLPENETTAVDNNSWIEFSTDFVPPALGGTDTYIVF